MIARPLATRSRAQRPRRVSWLPVAIATAIFALPSAPHAQETDLTRFELPNGMRVILQPSHATPIVAVSVWYRVGSADDPPERAGMSHLLEHLMFGGTPQAPSGRLDEWLNAEGSRANASTTSERTAYFESMPSHALPLALWLEADRMAHLGDALDSARLETERQIVMNERRERVDGPAYGRSYELVLGALFGSSHPYATLPVGRMHNVERITLQELRDFHRMHYSPANATLAIVGDFDADSIRTLVTQWFGRIPGGPLATRATLPDIVSAAPDVTVADSSATSPGLFLAWETVPAFHETDAAFDVLAHILGGGSRSRLRHALVDSAQLAVSVESAQYSAHRLGFFLLSATLSPNANVARARRVIAREIARLHTEGPSPSELERAKAFLRGQLLDRSASVADRAEQVNFYAYYAGEPEWLRADLARYEGVTASEVRRAAGYLVGRGASLLMVPPGEVANGGPR